MSVITFDGKIVEPPPQSKQAIVGSLSTLEALIRDYVDHLAPRDRLTVQLTFSAFLIWARKKIEAERNGG
jgi:hypothetical protein